MDQRLGHPPSRVGAGAVDLGHVLTGEGAAAVRAPAAVRVDDDLAAGEAAVALGAADGEEARRVDVVDGLVVEHVGGDERLDHVLHQVQLELLLRVLRVVLRRDDDGVHAEGLHEAALLLVLNSDLRLAVRAEEREQAVLADDGELVAQARGERVRQRHELGGLVRSVTEHVALVAGANLLGRGLALLAAVADGVADLDRLLVEAVHDEAGLVVEALFRGVEADALDGLADDGLVVEDGVRGNLAEDHDEARARAALAGDARRRVLREARVDDGVGDLVRELVRVALVDRLGREHDNLSLLLRDAHDRLQRRQLGVDLRQHLEDGARG
mmetsp:Transcript_14467/g.51425  ORF Transcript_14467/g.51425 Transcript_14467/m.51425 type:complete len:328 (-) Transcript_14467:270-1253(-)